MAAPSPLFIRLYVDEDVHPMVAAALRARGFDAISVHETGRRGLADSEQMVFAVTMERALLTFNMVDFLELHRERLKTGQSHWGIILCEQAPVGEMVRRLLNLLNRVTADELRNQVYWLQSFR